MLDTKALDKNEDFDKIRDTYVIFITENDVFGKQHPLYTIDRTIKETHDYFNDGEHIIYINTAYKGEGMTDIEKLIHDFTCSDPEQMLIPSLRKRCMEIKSGTAEKEVDKMCKLLDLRIQEEHAEGRTEERISMAKKMLKKNQFTDEMIAELCELTIEEVNELKENLSA